MAQIYDILAKHFLNQTNVVEGKQVLLFKNENPVEYKMYKQLWDSKEIKVKDFDSQKAWQIVQSKVLNEPKIVPMYRKFSRIAIVAAMLIVGAISVYYYAYTTKEEVRITQITSDINGKEIMLVDGSKIWLNKNAALLYPEKFGKDVREITLKGEAYFEVARNDEKPFIINANKAKVTVLGTSFNVNSAETSTEVIVNSGKVKVDCKNSSNFQIITKGYSAKVLGDIVEKYKTKNNNYLAWKTGQFIFYQTSIDIVVEDLNSFYSTTIEVNNPDINCKLTANFDHTSLNDILEIIKMSCDVTIVKTVEKIIIE